MDTYIHRAAEALVRRYSRYFKVVVVTGPRQVGKTTMLKHLADEDRERGLNRTYVSLDNTAIRETAREDPALFMQRWKPPVLIDEIQKAPELLPYIKEIVDASDTTGAIWLTGSQPFHLMKNVSETLAGRVGIIELLGLSNAELDGRQSEPFRCDPDYFLRKVGSVEPSNVSEVFRRIFAGSLPALREMPDDMRASGYESYIDTYVMRDIRDLTQVADELKFRRFMRACAASTARPVVYAELARAADIDEKTAKAWLSLLVSSYLVKIVEPFSNNLIKRISKQPVLHFTDTGLAAYLAGWTTPESLESGAMNGHIFESYAFSELHKSYLNAGRVAPFAFFKTNDKKEIDLLLESDGVIYPIEIKKTASPSKTDTRNMGALDPVSADGIPAELAPFKRTIGTGCVLCMTQDTYPVSSRAWAFPVWAI